MCCIKYIIHVKRSGFGFVGLSDFVAMPISIMRFFHSNDRSRSRTIFAKTVRTMRRFEAAVVSKLDVDGFPMIFRRSRPLRSGPVRNVCFRGEIKTNRF